MRLKVQVKHAKVDLHPAPSSPEPIPMSWPIMLWEPTYEILMVASHIGTGTVLAAGKSQEVTVGMVLPYAASRWIRGDERYDFIPAPEGMTVTIGNTSEKPKQSTKRGR